jgi:hypothetical protein
MGDQSKTYPHCGALGSDAAELQAFGAYIDLLVKLESDGHSRRCAELILGDDRECTCAPGESR